MSSASAACNYGGEIGEIRFIEQTNHIKVIMRRFFVNLNIGCGVLLLIYPVISSAITMLEIHMNTRYLRNYSMNLHYFVYACIFIFLLLYCYKKRNVPDYWRRDRYRSHLWGHALLIIVNSFAALSVIIPTSLAWVTGNSNWMFLLWILPMFLIFSPILIIFGLTLIWRSRKIQ